MEFYVRKNGRTLGPLLYFQLRDMLQEGEIDSHSPVWHEGMESWRPLEEVGALSSLRPVEPDAEPQTEVEQMPRTSVASAAATAANPPQPSADTFSPPLPQRLPPPLPHPYQTQDFLMQLALRENSRMAWRRWAARVVDGMLFASLIVTCLALAGVGDWFHFLIRPPFLALGIPLVWMFLEAAFLTLLGTTPGKAMLGLSVRSREGGRMAWRVAMARSFDVWFFGSGANLPYVQFPLWLFHFLRFRRAGIAPWDHSRGTVVESKPVPKLGIVLLSCILLGWLGIGQAILLRAPIPPWLGQREREMVENLRNASAGAVPPKDAAKPKDEKSTPSSPNGSQNNPEKPPQPEQRENPQ
jgi:uncharacterized RDD family membrane protein YckC